MHAWTRFLFPWGGNRCAGAEGGVQKTHRYKEQQVILGIICTIPAIVGPRSQVRGGLPVRYIM